MIVGNYGNLGEPTPAILDARLLGNREGKHEGSFREEAFDFGAV
jgi:hypothetical protein